MSRGRRSRRVPEWRLRAGEPSHFSEKENFEFRDRTELKEQLQRSIEQKKLLAEIILG